MKKPRFKEGSELPQVKQLASGRAEIWTHIFQTLQSEPSASQEGDGVRKDDIR